MISARYRHTYSLISFITIIATLLPSTTMALDEKLLHVPVNTGLEAPLNSIDSSTKDVATRIADHTEIFRKLISLDDNSIRAFLGGNPVSGVNGSAELILSGRTASLKGGKTALPGTSCTLRPISGISKATDGGAWEKLIVKGELGKPLTFSDVMVNDSTSVSCLLQEIVEQNKLALNLQIHQLLNDHIQAVQAKAFANKAQNISIGLNMEWMKKGNIRVTKDEEGEIVDETNLSVFGNPNDIVDDTTEREANALVRMLIGNDPSAPQVNLAPGINPYKIARQLITEMRAKKETTKQKTARLVSCDVLAPISAGGLGFDSLDSYQRFVDGDVTAYKGSYSTILTAINNNPACSERGVEEALRGILQSRSIAIAQELEQDRMANGGVQSIRRCANEDCSETEEWIPGFAAKAIFTEGITASERKLENVRDERDLAAIEGNVSISNELFSSGINNIESGQFGADTVEAAIGRFYNAIEGGYFDLQGGTTDWALGAMLQIYDRLIDREGQINPNNGSGGVDAEE